LTPKPSATECDSIVIVPEGCASAANEIFTVIKQAVATKQAISIRLILFIYSSFLDLICNVSYTFLFFELSSVVLVSPPSKPTP
jgi:hypothetical protein